MKRKIFPSITSTDGEAIKKIEEADRLRLKELCLFLTAVSDIEKRKSLYAVLEKTTVKKIPLVHLRNDTEPWEIEYLLDRFKTEVFCAHSAKEYPFVHDWSAFINRIYYENTVFGFVEEEVKIFAGICIDFAHLDGSYGLLVHNYPRDVEVIKKYPCGCAHIGAIPKSMTPPEVFEKEYHLGHLLKDFSDLDYLTKYPKSFFPGIIALELENSLGRQLEIKDYLEKLLALN